MFQKLLFRLVILIVFLFTASAVTAQAELSNKLGVRVEFSGEMGGVFGGNDGKMVVGGLAALYLAPQRLLKITNVNVISYSTEVFESGATKNTILDFTPVLPSFKRYFTDLKELKELAGAMVEESTFRELDTFSFGIVTGISNTGDYAFDKNEDNIFYPITYIPVLASIQHNFIKINPFRHVYTLIKETTGKKREWDFQTSQIYMGYRISGGIGIITDSASVVSNSSPLMLRLECTAGSRDGAVSFLNTSFGYNMLFIDGDTVGSAFLTWGIIFS